MNTNHNCPGCSQMAIRIGSVGTEPCLTLRKLVRVVRSQFHQGSTRTHSMCTFFYHYDGGMYHNGVPLPSITHFTHYSCIMCNASQNLKRRRIVAVIFHNSMWMNACGCPSEQGTHVYIHSMCTRVRNICTRIRSMWWRVHTMCTRVYIMCTRIRSMWWRVHSMCTRVHCMWLRVRSVCVHVQRVSPRRPLSDESSLQMLIRTSRPDFRRIVALIPPDWLFSYHSRTTAGIQWIRGLLQIIRNTFTLSQVTPVPPARRVSPSRITHSKKMSIFRVLSSNLLW